MRVRSVIVLLAALWAVPVEAQFVRFPSVEIGTPTIGCRYQSLDVADDNPNGDVTGSICDQVNEVTTGVIWTKTSGTATTSGWVALTSSSTTGTVTSVALTAPGMFSVSGSPITTSGTLAVSLVNQNANVVFAGPASGSATAPTFRKIVFGDWATNSCASGQIPKFDGADWVCDDDAGASTGAPNDAFYITQQADGTLTNEQSLAALSTGLVKVTTTTGVLSTAAAGTDYVVPGGNVATATALAANGANCSAGNYPLGVDASGAVESCTAVSGGGHTIANEGTPLTDRATLNFVGAGVNCVDDSGNDETDCTISGGGGGAWSLRFTALGNIPPASNPATFNTRNATPVLEFDTSTQEGAMFLSVLPNDYGGGGVTVCAHWAAASATTGTIGWDVAFERIGDGSQDLDADGFGTAATITATTVPGTSGHVDITCVNIADGSDMDSTAAGEAFRLRIRRDVSNDTATGDAQLVAVDIREQ